MVRPIQVPLHDATTFELSEEEEEDVDIKKLFISMNYLVSVNFFKYTLFGSPFLLSRVPIGSPFHSKLGPHWVPMKNILGPHSMWEQCSRESVEVGR